MYSQQSQQGIEAVQCQPEHQHLFSYLSAATTLVSSHATHLKEYISRTSFFEHPVTLAMQRNSIICKVQKKQTNKKNNLKEY